MTEEAKKIVEALRMCHDPKYGCYDCPVDVPGEPCQNELKAADLIESLSEQLDAAVRDMGMTAHCDICAHHRNNGGNCIGVSMCGQRRPRWQWRGTEVER